MGRRLFEDVAVPGPGGGKRRARLLPVSVAIHAVVLGVVLVTPVLTPGALPAPATGGRILVPAMLAPPPPPPRGVPQRPVTRRLERADSPAPAARGIVLSVPASWSELPPAGDLAWGPDDMPECDGCVPWGVDGGIPVQEPLAPEATPAKPVVRIGRGIEAPVKLRDVKPDYPELALLTRVEGVVIVECRVDESGRVADARVLRGHPLLDAAALDAIRQWRYRPTLLNGNPVSVVMTVTVRFQLRR